MRYVIIGAGAVGGVIGFRLHDAGNDVLVVARGDHLAAVRSSGLRLVTPDGSRTARVPTVGDVRHADLQPDHVIIVAVKSQQTAGVIDALDAAAPPDIAVFCAQNGVSNEAIALRRFRHVYGVCVLLPSQHLVPGEVVQQSSPVPGVLDLGRYPGGSDDVAATVAGDLRAAGFESEVDAAVMARKYRKLLTNLSNSLGALCGGSARSSSWHAAQRRRGPRASKRRGLACSASRSGAADGT